MAHRHLQGLARHGNTRDGNERPIIEALKRIHATVLQLDKPCDLLVGYRGRNFLLEVKLPAGPRGGTSHSELNDDEMEFRATWKGQYEVVRSPEDAIEIVVGPVPPEDVRIH
jgi:hypothetical protein